jgi:LmbE family N-acetylglucosaminyl deacetylase
MTSILVVAAHPDDEILGCGGTIAKHVQAGDEVHVVIMAEGLTSRASSRSRDHMKSDLESLAQCARDANAILGSHSVTLHDFPDNRLDSVDLLDLIKTVETHIEKHRPSIVYTHHKGDLNIDHRLVHEAVVTACRPLPLSCVSDLLFFEIPSSTEWQTASTTVDGFFPNWFIEIRDTLPLKTKALSLYHSELRPWPHPRSTKGVELLAAWRGTCVGIEAAEAFMVGRVLRKI